MKYHETAFVFAILTRNLEPRPGKQGLYPWTRYGFGTVRCRGYWRRFVQILYWGAYRKQTHPRVRF